MTFAGADPDGLADLALALGAAADELERRASSLSCELAVVTGPADAGAGVALVARWCRAQQDDVVRRAVGFDDDPFLGAVPGMAGAALFGPGMAGASVWSLVTSPGEVAGALRAVRAGRPVAAAVPVLLPLSLVGNVVTLADGDAAAVDRVLAGVGAGADAATLYLLAVGATGAGLVVVGVVAGVVTAVQLWRSREELAGWLDQAGGMAGSGGAATEAALDAAAEWAEEAGDGVGGGVETVGAGWAGWLEDVADDADVRGLPAMAMIAGVGAVAVHGGTALVAGAARANAGAVASVAGRAGDAMAAVGRGASRAAGWVAARLDGDDEGEEDEAAGDGHAEDEDGDGGDGHAEDEDGGGAGTGS